MPSPRGDQPPRLRPARARGTAVRAQPSRARGRGNPIRAQARPDCPVEQPALMPSGVSDQSKSSVKRTRKSTPPGMAERLDIDCEFRHRLADKIIEAGSSSRELKQWVRFACDNGHM